MTKLVEKFENSYLKYATGLLLLVIPLYPKFPLLFVPGTYVAIRLEDFLIAILLLGWLIIILRRRLPIWRDPIVVSVFWFFLALALSVLSAVLVTKTVEPHIGFLHAARRVEYLAVLFLAAVSVRSRENLWFFLKLVVVGATVATLYGAGQKFLALPVISTMNKEFAQGLALSLGPEARVNATFAGHYDLAAYLVPVLLVALGSILVLRKWWEKLGFFVLFSLFVWLMLASASRISFVAYLFPAILMLLLVRKWGWIIPVAVVSLTMAAFSQNLTSRYAKITNVAITQAYERLVALRSMSRFVTGGKPEATPTPSPEEIAGGAGVTYKTKTPKASPKPRRPRPTPTATPVPVVEDRSMAIRLNVEWPRAVRAFEKNPLLGTGPSSITLASDNDYLRALGETGLVGFVALINVFLQVWLAVRRLLKKSVSTTEGAFGWAMTLGTFGLLINAMFIDVFEASKVAIFYWLLVGIWIGTARFVLTGKKP